MPRRLTEAFTRDELVMAFRHLGAEPALCEAEADIIFAQDSRSYWFDPGFFRDLSSVSPEFDQRVRSFLEEHALLHFTDASAGEK
jgi:hypothetical protein